MKRGEIRYCACGCGEPAKRMYTGNRFKSWRAYATGHAPNERVVVRVPTDVAVLAYAAGILDGEGCIYARVQILKNGSTSTFLQLQVMMCSDAVVAWFAEHFGGDVYVDQPRSLNNRARFAWQMRGRNVGLVLLALLPYLKEKKQRATLAIELSSLLRESKPGKKSRVSSLEYEHRVRLAGQIKAFNQNLRSEDVLH